MAKPSQGKAIYSAERVSGSPSLAPLAGDDTSHVMASLVAAIHVFNRRKDVDARHKAGHDVAY
jgi:hypothetical protein